jgi:Holliday junction resolvase RusA-like endonuclease
MVLTGQTLMRQVSSSEWTDSKLKPLSINQAFCGKKVKTGLYRKYEAHLMRTLPSLSVPPEGPLELRVVVYYSNRGSDIDNCLKPFIDVLSKRYDFNDNRIYRLRITKAIVKKGEENIAFRILPFVPTKVPLLQKIKDFWYHITCPKCGESWSHELKEAS